MKGLLYSSMLSGFKCILKSQNLYFYETALSRNFYWKRHDKKETFTEATSIGDDSYELQAFMQLKTSASTKKQIEALKSDQRWQQDHLDEVSGRIDRLMHKLEFE